MFLPHMVCSALAPGGRRSGAGQILVSHSDVAEKSATAGMLRCFTQPLSVISQ